VASRPMHPPMPGVRSPRDGALVIRRRCRTWAIGGHARMLPVKAAR
jgi:hypothetical protein